MAKLEDGGASGRPVEFDDRAQRGAGESDFDSSDLADMVAPICERCKAWIIGDEVKFAGQSFCSVECLWIALEVA